MLSTSMGGSTRDSSNLPLGWLRSTKNSWMVCMAIVLVCIATDRSYCRWEWLISHVLVVWKSTVLAVRSPTCRTVISHQEAETSTSMEASSGWASLMCSWSNSRPVLSCPRKSITMRRRFSGSRSSESVAPNFTSQYLEALASPRMTPTPKTTSRSRTI